MGSNGWAIGGANTDGGSSLVASDMHLGLRLPAASGIARSCSCSPPRARRSTVDLNGVTLPGAHVLVAGSNGRIAWGVPNSYSDWADLTFVPCTAVDNQSVRTATETIELTTLTEKIPVKGHKLPTC